MHGGVDGAFREKWEGLGDLEGDGKIMAYTLNIEQIGLDEGAVHFLR